MTGGAARTTGTAISRAAGQRLLRERTARGLSPDELALLISSCTGPGGPRMNAKLVRLIERGITEGERHRTRVMSVDEAALLTRVLGIPLGEFLEEEKDHDEKQCHPAGRQALSRARS